jgi:hypothetical protein
VEQGQGGGLPSAGSEVSRFLFESKTKSSPSILSVVGQRCQLATLLSVDDHNAAYAHGQIFCFYYING